MPVCPPGHQVLECQLLIVFFNDPMTANNCISHQIVLYSGLLPGSLWSSLHGIHYDASTANILATMHTPAGPG